MRTLIHLTIAFLLILFAFQASGCDCGPGPGPSCKSKETKVEGKMVEDTVSIDTDETGREFSWECSSLFLPNQAGIGKCKRILLEKLPVGHICKLTYSTPNATWFATCHQKVGDDYKSKKE